MSLGASSMRKLTLRVLVASIASCAAVLSFVGTSTAQPMASVAPSHVTSSQRGMEVIGFNRAVAEAHGYEIVTLPDGRQASVPKAEAEHARAAGTMAGLQPDAQDTKFGTCGYSYVELDDGGGGGVAYLRTGFHVNFDAISYAWWVQITDNNGRSHQNWGSALTFQTDWTSGILKLGLYAGGDAKAEVIPDNSWALLVTGSICVSGGPEVTQFIS